MSIEHMYQVSPVSFEQSNNIEVVTCVLRLMLALSLSLLKYTDLFWYFIFPRIVFLSLLISRVTTTDNNNQRWNSDSEEEEKNSMAPAAEEM